uniref:Apoptosis inhibitor n=1 Tax=Anoplophora glabripennis TaxID=217634 RepID=V5H1N8_ANOGL
MCIEDFSDVYNYLSYNTFEKRLLSFEKYTGFIEPTELAWAGFYYTGESDIVKCYYCNIEIYKWKVGDIAIKDHLKYSNNCTYATLIKEKFNSKIGKENTSTPSAAEVVHSNKTNRLLYFLLCINILSTVYSIFH